MKSRLKIFISLVTLITTLACSFVYNMIFPPTVTPTRTASPAIENTPTAPPTETPTSTSTPFDNPEPIVCSDDECLNACLERLSTVLETSPLDSIGNTIYEEQSANFNLVIYKVDGDEIGEPAVLYVPSEYRKYQEDTASHLRIWKFYAAIIPPELREFVSEFVIYTDGPEGDSVAWVNPSPANADSWQVGFDLLNADYPPFLADSLVHETAHVLTLNTAQIPSEQDRYYSYDPKQKLVPGCEQYAVHGKCSLPDSYINLFYQRFWKDHYAEWWEIEQEATTKETFDEYMQVMEQYYDEHSDWFINSYAATNVEEDMAESFAFFALNPKPSGDEIYEQKVAFYYDFPELVEYRQQMIEGVCSYIR